ncbi:MAG: GAF domain-containing protein [Vicingaceae bacterium]|nr:GAF domain-containing protein [Vicingaceae bacterium]
MKRTLTILTYLLFAAAFAFGYFAFTSAENTLIYFSASCASFIGIILILYYQLSLEKKQNENLTLNNNVENSEEEEERIEETETTNLEEEIAKRKQQFETYIPTITPSELKTKEDYIISKIVELTHSDIGILYNVNQHITAVGTYAHVFDNEEDKTLKKTEGLLGQVVKSKTQMHLTKIPEGYISIISGLGKSNPNNALLFPLVDNEKVVGIIEIAAFEHYTTIATKFLEEITPVLIKTLKNTTSYNE